MRFLFAALLISFLLVKNVSASLVAQNPEDDPFYLPANGFENAKNGDVLKDRKVVVALSGLVPVAVEAYQLQYRTQSINGSAITSVTTLMKPLGAKTDRFINYQTAQDSIPLKCAPSYILRFGANQKGSFITLENLFIQTYLVQGYIVNSPDYEGPEGAFSAGHLEGMGVLDSIRAVKNYGEKIGLEANPSVIAMGYSGGAIATGWAANLQSSYAPDLDNNMKGWISGGTPANLTGTAVKLDGTEGVGFLFGSVVGLSLPSSYGSLLQPVLQNIATPIAQEGFQYAKTHCTTDLLKHFTNETFQSTKYFTIGDRVLYQPTIQTVLKNQTMGIYPSEHPIQPVLLYHEKNDEIVPYQDAIALSDRWCDQGAKVRFITLEDGGHAQGELDGIQIGHNFVADTFNNKNPITTCTKETDSGSFDPLALGSDLQLLLSEIEETLNNQS